MGILLTIAVPAVGNRVNQARTDADTTNISLLQGAQDMYYRDHNEYPVNPSRPEDPGYYAHDCQHDLVRGDYLREIPASPFGIDPGYRREGNVVISPADGVYYNIPD